MKKKYVLFVLIVAVAVLMISCTSQVDLKRTQPEEKEKLTIGFSMGTLLEDRWVRDRDIFLARAQQQGIEVIVTNANRDSDLQYEQVKDMLEQGIDILVLAPHDSTKEVRCVELAKQNDVPVISYDRLVYQANVDAYVSFDNEQVGRLMAQALVEKVPRGGYLIVGGSSNDNNSATVMRGVNKVLDPYIKSGDIELLDSTWIDGWVREDAYAFVVSSIEKFGDRINGIIVGNDSMAWGVIDALFEAQMADKVSVVGQDADLVACRRIVQGTQLMTVYKPIVNLVDEAMQLCVELAEGKKIDASVQINDGIYSVPFRKCEVVAVTEHNMEDTVIRDNFHRAEEIYQQQQQGEENIAREE